MMVAGWIHKINTFFTKKLNFRELVGFFLIGDMPLVPQAKAWDFPGG